MSYGLAFSGLLDIYSVDIQIRSVHPAGAVKDTPHLQPIAYCLVTPAERNNAQEIII